MKIFDMPQLSPEWFDIKRGKISASNMSKVIAKGQGKVRKSYMLKLCAEILTGQSVEGYSSAEMERGTELEPQARAEYEKTFDASVNQVGWVEQENKRIGCSPDGQVSGSKGMVEFKCPLPTTHIEYCLMGEGWTPPPYYAQLQGQIWVSERDWVDFVSFAPEINGRYFYCVRVTREENYIKNLEKECNIFLEELDEMVDKMQYFGGVK